MQPRSITKFSFVSIFSAVLLLSAGARADELSAIVEDAAPSVRSVGLFDYLSPGTELNLTDEDWLVLSYLHSCKQEQISGGTITIGENESTASGSTVKRRSVECDGGSLQLSAEQSDRASVAVMHESGGEGKVALTVRSLSPVFRISGTAGTLILESLDWPQGVQNLKFKANKVDLAQRGVKLLKGGLYRATTAERETVFRVDKFARPGAGPLLSRLIPL